MMHTHVLGIGGAGCRMAAYFVQRLPARVYGLNTDQAALNDCPLADKLLLGPKTCQGRPAGVPTFGQRAATESRSGLLQLMASAQRLVLVTGLGGGTGTGATPAIAKMAQEIGVSVQVVATLPLRLEKRRREQAQVAADQWAADGMDLILHDHEDMVIRHAGHASLDDYFLRIDQWVVEDFLTRETHHAQ
jgi:cell division protein FtsZ